MTHATNKMILEQLTIAMKEAGLRPSELYEEWDGTPCVAAKSFRIHAYLSKHEPFYWEAGGCAPSIWVISASLHTENHFDLANPNCFADVILYIERCITGLSISGNEYINRKTHGKES